MLLYKEFKSELALQLKEGGFFENAIITNIERKNDYISVTTTTGDVYNFHQKPKGYNVFRKAKKRVKK